MPIDQPAALVVAEHEDREVVGVPDRGGLVGIFFARRQHLSDGEQAALLTDWIAPTVATDTGAGRVQLTIVPSGAIIVIGLITPSFHTMS